MGFMADLTSKMIGGADKELETMTAPKDEKRIVSLKPERPATANPNGTPAERKMYSDWYTAFQNYNKAKK